MLSLKCFLREGRVVGPCWEKLKPKGPKVKERVRSVSMGTSWYTFTHPNRAPLYLLYTSLCTGELNAIRKHKCFRCNLFYVKLVSLGYVGLN